MNYSPLRYPGGKNKLSAFVANICIKNDVSNHYIEPFCGGASVALFLLLEGFVKKITINDRDRSIYAFWYSVLNKTKQLCELIESTEVTVEEWRRQKEIQKNKKKADLLELGFSTFFMNRTNRSGIITAGIIGGVNQDGDYLLDCRYNKTDLINRIKKIANRKKDIKLYKKDALRLIDKIQEENQSENMIFYFDPPYFSKASTLYMNHYMHEDHKLLSSKIRNIDGVKWIVSYDNQSEIRGLYHGFKHKEFSFKHTAYEIREGKEILFFSNNVRVSNLSELNPLNFKFNRKKRVITNKY